MAKRIFSIIQILLFFQATLFAQELTKLFKNELPTGIFLNRDVESMVESKLQFIKFQNPSMFYSYIQYLDLKFKQTNVEQAKIKLNEFEELNKIISRKIMDFVYREIKKIDRTNYLRLERNEAESLIEDIVQIDIENLPEKPLPKIKENKNFYLMYKYYANDASLKYDKDKDYKKLLISELSSFVDEIDNGKKVEVRKIQANAYLFDKAVNYFDEPKVQIDLSTYLLEKNENKYLEYSQAFVNIQNVNGLPDLEISTQMYNATNLITLTPSNTSFGIGFKFKLKNKISFLSYVSANINYIPSFDIAEGGEYPFYYNREKTFSVPFINQVGSQKYLLHKYLGKSDQKNFGFTFGASAPVFYAFKFLHLGAGFYGYYVQTSYELNTEPVNPHYSPEDNVYGFSVERKKLFLSPLAFGAIDLFNLVTIRAEYRLDKSYSFGARINYTF